MAKKHNDSKTERAASPQPRPDKVGERNFRLLIGGIMSTATTASPTRREPELLGQTVVVIDGSAGIGPETARRARAEGAKLILTGRNPERLQRAASELDALITAAFDATDSASLERFSMTCRTRSIT
jgi:hypothetical protein